MKHELFTLKNVGPATFKDLDQLNIHTLKDLAQANPDELYKKLQIITQKKHDPCVWDVFAAIIHEAKTGTATSWWDWTEIRKKRQANGTF